MRLDWNSQRGGRGGSKEISLPWGGGGGGMDIFWNQTILQKLPYISFDAGSEK